MRDHDLPQHVIAWCEQQVALGRSANVAAYLSDLIAKDRNAQHRLNARRSAVAEGRASGISMADPHDLLTRLLARSTSPALARLAAAIAEGRASGTTFTTLNSILERALGASVRRAA